MTSIVALEVDHRLGDASSSELLGSEPFSVATVLSFQDSGLMFVGCMSRGREKILNYPFTTGNLKFPNCFDFFKVIA